MKINKIHLYHVAMPLTEPWVTAYGNQADIESLFVGLESDDLIGWGECAPAPLPFYNSEYTAGAFYLALEGLGPRLINQTITSADQLTNLFAQFKGNEFAKSAFDAARWDLNAKKKQTPLWKLIGGSNPEIEVGADIPVQTDVDKLIDRAGEAIDQGYKRVKFKFNRQCSFEMMEAVRNCFPDLVMHIDCNSGFTLDDLDLFRKLDGLNLRMIEQPLAYDDLVDHAKLQKELSTPICLDESISSLARAKKAIEIKACRWINIKTSRVGGLTNALQIQELCSDNKIPVWVGGMLESATGQAPSIALELLPSLWLQREAWLILVIFSLAIGSIRKISLSPKLCIAGQGQFMLQWNQEPALLQSLVFWQSTQADQQPFN